MRAPSPAVVCSSIALAISLSLVACGVQRAPDPEEATSRVASPIINGELDTTHQAVVAVVAQDGNASGLCSGTIIKVDATTKVGWVFTAAHCVDVAPVMVLQGDDFFSDQVIRYEILDYTADARYDGQTGSPFDFAMVRILGVDATTPTIPVATSPDGLAAGTPVVSVGYGRTTLLSAGDTDQNTKRRRVAKTLSQVSSTLIAYDMSTRGICQGDSGGPVLVTSGGVEKVAGIHSFVQGDCNGFGVSGRTTAAASFIAAELAKAPPPATCKTCEAIANSGNNECANLTRACLADTQCGAFYNCITGCGNTETCRASCVKKFPKAEGPFTAATACTCTRACSTQCNATFACKSIPKCGYALPAGECSTCTEGACCDQTFACTADAVCFGCLKGGDADPACATNAKRKALATCVATSCKEPCAGSGLDTGAEVPVEEAPAEEPAAQAAAGKKDEGCSVAAPGQGGAAAYGASGVLLAFASLLAARRRRARSAVQGVRVLRSTRP